MRAFAALTVTVALTAALAGCAANPDTDSNPDESAAPSPAGSTDCLASGGSGVDAVSVTGEFGTTPVIEFEAPLSVEKTQRAVAIEGDGDLIASGDDVNVYFGLWNATTGEEIPGTGFTEGAEVPMAVDEQQILPGLVKTLQCAPEGSRVVGVLPPADLWGAQGLADLEVKGTDSLVFVADIVSRVKPLEPATWTENVPTVDLESEAPVVTLPQTEPSPELQLAVLEEGNGDVVEDGATVTVHYQGTSWNTGEIFDQSYTRGEPATFSTDGVIPGFAAAMIGQKVGSTVIVTIPPKDAYGPEGAGHALSGQTLVFLIQIEDAQ
ncbi:FKBP-type peptidyl-prolyl cis-trans isomerase [Ruicaihuangia caeni]|uniref:peptidylprolyl isomerase n=1 Tax=Ruicaihuangia caeni TaxID=3042517 RepID=A0AAW6T6Q4_9MICO|nr:FKBP-type peptidyl-prolyl cis-trans isomerase [Klugiella sp. YN-L-19]MDI2097503.1 FKBP-type peptidyl-prolyl cis-trans isomerase [Klugiella sp. YN-L-19]